MKRRLRARVLASASITLALCLAWVGPAPAAVANADQTRILPTDPKIRWCTTMTPNPNGSSGLSDVAVLPDGRAWTVGFTFTASSMHALIESFDGTAWTVERTPNPDPSIDRLDAVSALAPDNAWAVGRRSFATLAEHWDGVRWSVVGTPNAPHQMSFLQGMTALSPTDIWAVGNTQTLDGVATGTLVEHWDGRRWSIVPSPNPSETFNFLEDISPESPGDIWAVGTYQAVGRWRTLIEHWNGQLWSVVPSPSPGSVDNRLEGVAAIGRNDAWVVGHQTNDGTSARRPLAERWNGKRWTVVAAPPMAAQFTDVATSAHHAAWGVGYFEEDPRGEGLIEHWTGSEWIVSPPIRGVISGVSSDVSGRLLWAVGSLADQLGDLRPAASRPCQR